MFRFVFALISTLSALSVAAQTATISGLIVDATTGEPLPGATVLLTGRNKGATSNAHGEFSLKGLSAGEHSATFSFVGYSPKTVEFTLLQGETKHLRVELTELAQDIEEVRVTAKSEARQLREAAMPIAVISMNELQGTVSDINEALSKTAGVKLRSTGGEGSATRLSVRGLEGKRIGYYLDGLPMNDHSDFININDIPVDMIDRIEVYKGVVPAKLGGTALGGAVNVITREYPPRYADVSYTVASFNTHKINAVLKFNPGRYEFGLGGFYTYSDNNYTMELPMEPGHYERRNHDRFRRFVLGSSFTSRCWWFDEVVFEPSFTISDKQIQGIEYNIQEAITKAKAFILPTRLERTNFLADGLDFLLDLVYAYTEHRLIDRAMQRYHWDGSTYPPATAFGGEIGLTPSNAFNTRFVVSKKLNLNYLLTKTQSINLNSTANFVRGTPTDPLKEQALGRKTQFDSQMYNWVLGLCLESRSPGDVLYNQLTAKYYRYDMTTKLRPAFGHGEIQDVHNVRNNWGVSEALRIRLLPSLLLRTSAAYDLRLPSDDELLGDGFMIMPSASLEPERNASFNLGLLFDREIAPNRRFSVELNGFYMYLNNMIRYVGGLLQSNYQNFGQMRTLGTDVEVKADATSFLYIYANATLQDLRDVRKFEAGSNVPNPTLGSRMPNIPYLYANAGFELHRENLFGGRGQNTRLLASCSFVEEYLYDFEQSKYQQRRIPRALTFDAGVEHSFFDQHLIVGFQMNNITDAKVISEYNRPLPGRNMALKVRYIMR